MLQESILYKIFLRYLKEKNMSLYFFKCNSKGYLSNVEYRIISENTNNLLSTFSLKYSPKSRSNDRNFNDFCNNWSNNIEFNLIILYAMKPYVKDFLKKEGVLKSFLKNLCKYNSHIQSLNIEENSIIKNTDLILDTYIDYLASQRDSIFRFINRAFNFWLVGNINLWSELNKEFNDYIIEKLLSKFERKEISNLKRLFLKLQNNIISLIKQKRR